MTKDSERHWFVVIVVAGLLAASGLAFRLTRPGPPADHSGATSTSPHPAAAFEQPGPADAPSPKDELDDTAVLELAARAMHALSTDPQAAERAFAALKGRCAGEAGLAYLAWDRGDLDAAAAHLTAAREVRGDGYCTVPDSKSLGEQILGALRYAMERIGHSTNSEWDTAFPCELYARHPREAFAASALYWGSTSDLPAFDAELECAHARIAASQQGEKAALAQRAVDALEEAPFQLVHVPSGTLWIAREYMIRSSVAEAIIAPELIEESTSADAEVASLSRRAAAQVPRMDERLATFAATRSRYAPTLAHVLCVIAAERGHELSMDRCARLAEYVASRAAARWLNEEPWDAFFMNGQP
jgi:hypothetical protein